MKSEVFSPKSLSPLSFSQALVALNGSIKEEKPLNLDFGLFFPIMG
jgi:hypothetical protein